MQHRDTVNCTLPKHIMKPLPLTSLLCVVLLIASVVSSHAADLLEPGKPIVVAGTHGRFDFLAVDVEGRRLLAAHTVNESLDVFDVDKQEVIKVIFRIDRTSGAIAHFAGLLEFGQLHPINADSVNTK